MVVPLPTGTRQGDVVIAPAGNIHLGAVLQQELGDTSMPPEGSKHQWTKSLLRTVLDVGLSLEKKLHDLLVTFPAGKGQRAILVTVAFDIDFGSVVEEELGHFLVTGKGSEHESGASVLGAMFHVGLALEKKLDNLDVAERTGPREGAVVRRLSRGIDVSVAVQQKLGNAHVTLATRLEERGVPGLVAVVDVRTALEEKLDYVLLSLAAGEAQHLVQANFGLGD